MKEQYIDKYITSNGEFIIRKKRNKICVFLFASIKFLTDRLLSLLGLIILSPLFIIISLLIMLDSKGPILFKQVRTGKKGKLFTMYKFRTMVFDNDVYDFKSKDKHTKIGKILRKTSLDEIPQLICILKGDMSFIGPRPWIVDYYDNMNDIQRHRYDVRPGLTGLAQASGRNNLSIFDKINYDLEYIKNYSLRQDIKVIFMTIKSVFTCCGCDAGKKTIQDELNALKKQNNKISKKNK